VWDQWTQTNISKIEAVQRRAARFTLGDYRRTSSVSFMLHQRKWDDLITRRQQSKVTMIYRVIHQLVAIPSAPYLQPTGVTNLQVQDKTIWLKTSEAGLVEAGSNPSLESL
jgi:hypothetical protein